MVLQAPLPPGFSELRPHQVDAIEEIVELFMSGTDVVYLDAPTGSGKTLIGHQVAAELNARALYVCSDKSLQDQFARDFKHAKVLKGRANYPVGTPQQAATAAECTATAFDAPCLFCPGGKPECPYEIAKAEAIAADLAVTNTAYLLAEANGPGRLKGRELVIADEGDTLETILMGYVEYRAPAKLVREVGMYSPKKGVHKKTLVEWLTTFAVALDTRLQKMNRTQDPQEYNRWLYAREDAQRMAKEVQDDIDYRESNDESTGVWLRDYEYSRDPNPDPGLVLKPVMVNKFGTKNLWRHGQLWLVMSATIISADEMSQSLGVVGDYATVTVPMTFPVENRPIILCPIANPTYKEMDKAILDLAHGIRVACEKHEGERVIVHTVSYKLARDLEEQLRRGEDRLTGRSIITYTEGRGREDALRKYKRTEGAVLLAPSMTRGIDLPDELCRVQIIAKCPFPALGDKQIASRLHLPGGQLWYTVKTIRDIVQMTGRAVRHKDDWAVTYIMDINFGRNLWSKWKRMFPAWWTESVNTKADIRDFIRRDGR